MSSITSPYQKDGPETGRKSCCQHNSPHRAEQAAHDLITALADAGMSAGRIDQVAEHILGGRHYDPAPLPGRFYAEFGRTAAIYVAELRELEAG